MSSEITAYHVFRTPGPRQSGWQCDAADGDDQTITEGYGKTPEQALKNCKKAMAKKDWKDRAYDYAMRDPTSLFAKPRRRR